MINSRISAAISTLKLAVRSHFDIGSFYKLTMSQRAEETLMEKYK